MMHIRSNAGRELHVLSLRETPPIQGPMGEPEPMDCPCCKQVVRVPTLAMILHHYRLTPRESAILGAIWKGGGHPVVTERIFDAMYADDPDGGPSQTAMYSALKVALCHLRKKLEGSGVMVEHAGYRRGYRLVLGVK